MCKNYIKVLFVMILALSISTISFALPIGYTKSTGPTVITSGTGLSWLSPVATVNVSYNEILSDITGIYDGYTHATVTEFTSLLDDYGLPDTYLAVIHGPTPAQLLAAQSFQTDFGLTQAGTNPEFTYGMLERPATGLTELAYVSVGSQGAIATGTTNGGWGDSDLSAGWVGHWLVKQENVVSAPVPEPTTVALLGIGLAGLAGAEVRRRRKKRTVGKNKF